MKRSPGKARECRASRCVLLASTILRTGAAARPRRSGRTCTVKSPGAARPRAGCRPGSSMWPSRTTIFTTRLPAFQNGSLCSSRLGPCRSGCAAARRRVHRAPDACNRRASLAVLEERRCVPPPRASRSTTIALTLSPTSRRARRSPRRVGDRGMLEQVRPPRAGRRSRRRTIMSLTRSTEM